MTLFDETFTAPIPESRLKVPVDESFFAAVPPFEGFCNADKESKIKRFFEVRFRTRNHFRTLINNFFNVSRQPKWATL